MKKPIPPENPQTSLLSRNRQIHVWLFILGDHDQEKEDES